MRWLVLLAGLGIGLASARRKRRPAAREGRQGRREGWVHSSFDGMRGWIDQQMDPVDAYESILDWEEMEQKARRRRARKGRRR